MKWLKREVEEVGLVTLYFLFCFGIILTLKKLFLADYHIEFYAVWGAVIGALFGAKIAVVLDHTRAGTRFDASRPLAVTVPYKTLVYGVAAFAVLFLEELFHAYRAKGQLGAALEELWAHRDPNVILARAICIGLAFGGYHLYAGIDRRLGKGTLWRILQTRDELSVSGVGHKAQR